MSFDHNILSNPAPETGGKAGALEGERDASLRLLPGDGATDQ